MKKIFIFMVILFFTGCAYKPPIQLSKSYSVVIKLKGLRFGDVGFLRYGNGDYTDLELFDAGNLVLKIEADKNICVNSHCFGKSEFNRRFLSKEYPKDFFVNVLRKRVIFQKRGYKKRKNGFIQRIVEKKLDIIYRIDEKSIYFKDRKNHILIKLKEMDG